MRADMRRSSASAVRHRERVKRVISGLNRKRLPKWLLSSGRLIKRFWKWLLITVAGGVVAAVVAGVIGPIVVEWIKNTINPPPPKPHIELTYPEVYLVRSTDFKNEHMNWFHLSVKNRADLHLTVRLIFTVEGPGIPKSETVDEKYVVKPREARDVQLNPIHLTTRDIKPQDQLRVIVLVQDDKGKELCPPIETIPAIRVLPDNMIDWDLRAPNKNPVPREFLLAFLTTWTDTKADKVMQRVSRLRGDLRPDADADAIRNWFKSSYSELFSAGENGENRVMVVDEKTLTFQGSEIIRTPDQVLEECNSCKFSPLEAALLLGSIARTTFRDQLSRDELRLVLFALPADGRPSGQMNILISWSSDSVTWHAVDLSQVNNFSFEENERLASARVTALLANLSVLSDLDEDGIYLREPSPSPVIVDFVRAGQLCTLTVSNRR